MSSSSSSSVACDSGSVISSSSLVSMSSGSMESLTAEEEAAKLAAAKLDEPVYYVVIMQRVGDHTLLAFRDPRKMIKAITPRLERREAGLWEGEIFIFYGRIVEYSEPVMNYRINIPDIGELAVSDASKNKYVRPIPKPEE